MKITPDNTLYARIDGGPGPQQAFDRLIVQLRKNGAGERLVADVAMRYFRQVLRPAGHSVRYAMWRYVRTKPVTDPIGCIFHHSGWIFFGKLK